MSESLIIDPGHGGSDPGAVGFGEREKDWTLKISLYQYNRLKELGANVGITRTDDRTLDSVPRTNLIRGKYDYCMSNHFNAFNGTARGVETIYSVHSNGRTARRIADVITETSGLPFRRVFNRRGNNGDYYFMHRLTGSTETTIVEYGFIDNRADHDYYANESNFYAVAEAVVKEWCDILGVAYRASGTTPKSSGSTTASSGSSNETGLPSTQRGDKGQTVRDLQLLLLDAGESLPRHGADGDFGAETEAAVQSFQRKHGLSSPSGNFYGVAGPATTTKLVELYQQKHGISSPSGNFFGVFGPATKEALRGGGFSFRHWNGSLIRNGDRGNSVKDLQERLISLGYALPRFGADGVMGDETTQAVRAFQRDAGIGVDGKPGAQTHRALEEA